MIKILEDGTITIQGVKLETIVNKNRNNVEVLLLLKDAVVKKMSTLKDKMVKLTEEILLIVNSIQCIMNTINQLIAMFRPQKKSMLEKICRVLV